jgi:hypothetical protein
MLSAARNLKVSTPASTRGNARPKDSIQGVYVMQTPESFDVLPQVMLLLCS